MAVNRFPAFMLYPKDYFSSTSTACFSAEQDGAFLNLLMRSWANDPPCTLPDDDTVLAQLSKLDERWPTVGAPVKAKFEQCGEGLLRNRKIYTIYREMEAAHRRRSKAAKDREKVLREHRAQRGHGLVTAKRQGNDGVALPSSSSSPSPSPSPEGEKKESENVGVGRGSEFAEEVFEAAWRAYPRRPGNSKADAFAAWRARIRDDVDPADLLAGVERYAAYVCANGNEGTRYVKMAATFFGPGEHWKLTWEIGGANDRRRTTPRSTAPAGGEAGGSAVERDKWAREAERAAAIRAARGVE